MKLYAVIDTNVVVSAFLRWDSVPGMVLEQSLIGSIIPLLSDEIMAEYENVLRRKKFSFKDISNIDFLETSYRFNYSFSSSNGWCVYHYWSHDCRSHGLRLVGMEPLSRNKGFCPSQCKQRNLADLNKYYSSYTDSMCT